jgi:hypothetical protein
MGSVGVRFNNCKSNLSQMPSLCENEWMNLLAQVLNLSSVGMKLEKTAQGAHLRAGDLLRWHRDRGGGFLPPSIGIRC